MARDFNIRDREWNSFYSHYLTHNDSLMEVTDSFELKLSSSVHQVPTHYTDNSNDSNSIINFLFPWSNSVKIDSYFILPEFWHLLDHIFLIADISIMEEFIQEKWQTIIRNSKEKENFVSELTNMIGNINTLSIPNKETLETIIQEYARISESIWYKFSKNVNITKCSKVWWNEEYHNKMNKYRFSKTIEN